MKANVHVSHAKNKDYELLFHASPGGEKLGVFIWVDTSSQNRRGGGSTPGIVFGIRPESMLAGELGSISLMAWHSQRYKESVGRQEPRKPRQLLTMPATSLGFNGASSSTAWRMFAKQNRALEEYPVAA